MPASHALHLSAVRRLLSSPIDSVPTRRCKANTRLLFYDFLTLVPAALLMIACIAVLMIRDAYDETQQQLGALWRWLPLGASMTLFIFVYGFFLMNVSMCAAAATAYHAPSERRRTAHSRAFGEVPTPLTARSEQRK